MRQLTVNKAECLHVAATIRERRQELGLSQAALGELIGVRGQQIAKVEHGKSVLVVGRIRAVCEALDITPNALLGVRGK